MPLYLIAASTSSLSFALLHLALPFTQAASQASPLCFLLPWLPPLSCLASLLLLARSLLLCPKVALDFSTSLCHKWTGTCVALWMTSMKLIRRMERICFLESLQFSQYSSTFDCWSQLSGLLCSHLSVSAVCSSSSSKLVLETSYWILTQSIRDDKSSCKSDRICRISEACTPPISWFVSFTWYAYGTQRSHNYCGVYEQLGSIDQFTRKKKDHRVTLGMISSWTRS